MGGNPEKFSYSKAQGDKLDKIYILGAELKLSKSVTYKASINKNGEFMLSGGDNNSNTAFNLLKFKNGKLIDTHTSSESTNFEIRGGVIYYIGERQTFDKASSEKIKKTTTIKMNSKIRKLELKLNMGLLELLREVTLSGKANISQKEHLNTELDKIDYRDGEEIKIILSGGGIEL